MKQIQYTKQAMQTEFEQLKAEIEDLESRSPRCERDELAESGELTVRERARYKDLILKYDAKHDMYEKRMTLARLARMLKIAK